MTVRALAFRFVEGVAAQRKLTFAANFLGMLSGRTLDGQPMQITLDADSNVRQGLFGTALRDDKDVKFKVSFGYGSTVVRTCVCRCVPEVLI